MPARNIVTLCVLIAVVAAGFLLAGCVARTDEERDITTTATPQNGPALYATHCAKCHGAQGVGGSAPRIKPPAYERQDLFMVIAQGKDGTEMAAYAGVLDEVEVDAIMDYLLAK